MPSLRPDVQADSSRHEWTVSLRSIHPRNRLMICLTSREGRIAPGTDHPSRILVARLDCAKEVGPSPTKMFRASSITCVSSHSCPHDDLSCPAGSMRGLPAPVLSSTDHRASVGVFE